MIGFYCFTQPAPPVELTVKQKVALLSATQKSGLLNYFVMGRSVLDTSRELGINEQFVQYLFGKMDEIQETSKRYMRGEVEVTPAVLNEAGEIITPAVMNTPPTTMTTLRTILNPLFDDFTTTQITAITNAMFKWSKHDGTGDFTFYATEIKK